MVDVSKFSRQILHRRASMLGFYSSKNFCWFIIVPALENYRQQTKNIVVYGHVWFGGDILVLNFLIAFFCSVFGGWLSVWTFRRGHYVVQSPLGTTFGRSREGPAGTVLLLAVP